MIFNIIVNLFMVGKIVFVVFNNNFVVENVVEKLESEGFGFIVVKFGCMKNKEVFIVN